MFDSIAAPLMTLPTRNKLSYLLRASLILVIGFICYWIITTFHESKQESLRIDAAQKAINYCKNLLDESGSIQTHNNQLYAGNISLHNNQEFVNKVKELTGFGCTIFLGDTRISTTAQGVNIEKTTLGTLANPEIKNTVLEQGKTFKGVTETIGKEWLIIYEPLSNKSNERIGMIAVFNEHQSFLADLFDFKLIVGIVIFLFVFFVQTLLWRTEVSKNKIKQNSKELNKSNQILSSYKKEVEKLIFVIEEIDQAIAIVGKDDKIEWINKAFEKNILYSREEAIGNKTSDLLCGKETDRSEIRKLDDAIFQKQTSIITTLLQYRKDGSSYWARIFLTPLVNEANELERYVVFSLDISKEKETRDSLEKSEANIRQIGETIDDMVYLYSSAYNRYEYISPKCSIVLGANQNFFYSGQSYVNLYVVDEYIDLVKKSSINAAKGIAYDIDYQIIINNEIRWINERAFPIKNDNGEFTKYSGICADITAEKRIQTELKQSYQSTQLLSEIGIELTEGLSVIKIIEGLHKKLKGIVDVHSFAIGIIKEQTQQLYFPKFIEDTEYKEVYHSLDKNILANICVRENREIVILDFKNEIDNYTKTPLTPTNGVITASVIYLPLHSKGKVIGVLTVQSTNTNAYDINQIKLLKNLSVNVSNAISNALLYKSLDNKVKARTIEVIQQKEILERTNNDIKILTEIGMDISYHIKMDDIVKCLYEGLKHLLKTDSFAVRIYNPETKNIHFEYEFEDGKQISSLPALHIDENVNYTAWCIRNKKDLLIGNSKQEFQDLLPEINTCNLSKEGSLIFCPMVVDETVIGVLTVQNAALNVYDNRERDILKGLAIYTGIALNNAQLYTSLESKVEHRTIELSNKNKEILDSINYAKNIQQATLTSDEERLKLFPNSFIFYQPKDIVSGDFYRIDAVTERNNNNLIAFVVADCTGHGVPGASLAILCSSIIRQSLTEKSVASPSDALEYARKQLNVLLQRSNNTIHDGMDVSFCVLDRATNTLYFSGAFNDCVIMRKGEQMVIRGDRAHVGYQEENTPFTNVKINLEKDDLIYLFTDGYLDQFGGPRDRKFSRKRFLALINEIKDSPMALQKELLEVQLDNWKGKNEQTDDICIMAVKI